MATWINGWEDGLVNLDECVHVSVGLGHSGSAENSQPVWAVEAFRADGEKVRLAEFATEGEARQSLAMLGRSSLSALPRLDNRLAWDSIVITQHHRHA